MKAKLLRKIRERFEIKKTPGFWYNLLDHRDGEVTKNISFEQALEFMMYDSLGYCTYNSWVSRRRKRDRFKEYNKIKKL